MISINNFHKGQTSSPYLTDGAFSKSANLDVFSRPGIARINYKPVKKSGEVVDELIYNFERNPSGYLVTEWKSPTANQVVPEYETWTNPANTYSSDNNYATASYPGGYRQHWYGFGFNIPTGATVTGVEVKVEAKIGGEAPPIPQLLVSLTAMSDSERLTEWKTTPNLTGSDYSYVLGGATDKWKDGEYVEGGWLDYININQTYFGVTHVAGYSYTSPDTTYSIDHIQIRVYYQANANQIFASGENGTIYKSDDAGDTWEVLASNKGNYIKIWKGYLVAIKSNVINLYNLASETWTDNWKTDLEITPEHFMLVSENDGNLYICNGGKVASIIELTTFDPADGGTFTYTLAHLTLYDPYQVVCLGEHREDLLVGAVQGTPSDPKVSSTIFIWDRATNEFQYPLFLSGEFITAILEVQNKTYIVTDLYGKIYSYSESGLIPLRRLPFDYDDGKHIRVGDKGHKSAGFWRNKILLGVSSEDGLSPAGIYGLYGESFNCEHLISTGEDGSNNDLIIGAVYPFNGDTLLYGWYDAESTEYGIDKISSTYNRATGYTSYFESIFYPVGTHLKPVSYQQTEIQLSRPLQTGEGIKLYYRKNIGDSWTLLETFNYTSFGAKSSLLLNKGIFGIINIQIRAELTTGASSKNTPLLLDIRFI